VAALRGSLARAEKGRRTTPDITFQLLDGTQAAAHAEELQALHAEVYADPPYRRHDDAAAFLRRFGVQRRQPGFVLAEARHGGYLVGYAPGMPLRPEWRARKGRMLNASPRGILGEVTTVQTWIAGEEGPR
jgi:hypothetical protein